MTPDELAEMIGFLNTLIEEDGVQVTFRRHGRKTLCTIAAEGERYESADDSLERAAMYAIVVYQTRNVEPG